MGAPTQGNRMAQADKTAPDWERIEASYRAGLLSVREIAASQGVSHVAIAKRAKRDGWVRDLSAKIKAKADSLVTSQAVTSLVTKEKAVTDRAIVDANAQVIANVRIAHRTDISRGRALAMALLGELESQTVGIELFQELGELLRSEDQNGQDRRNDLYQKVISSAGRIDGMKKLSDTLKTMVALEREAYNIGAAPDAAGSDGRKLRELTDEDLLNIVNGGG
jgi:hypothetical protein